MRQIVVDPAAQPVRNFVRNPTFANGLTAWSAVASSLSAEGGRCKVTASATTTTPRASAIAICGEIKPAGTYSIAAAIEPVSTKTTRFRAIFYNQSTAVGTSTGIEAIPQGRSVWLLESYAVGHTFDRVYLEFYATDGISYVTGDVAGWLDSVIINDGEPLAYADGDSYGWRWSGTPHFSESVGYLDPVSYVRNLVTNPRALALGGNGQPVGWNPSGAGVTISPTVDGKGGVLLTDPGTDYGSVRFPLTIGKTYTAMGVVEAVSAATVRIQIGSNTSAPLVPLIPGQVTTLRQTVVATTSYFYVGYGVPSQTGQIIIRSVMLVEGNYIGDYADGDYPGWHWTGAPNASESVGYPYRLEDIAGAPSLYLTSPGSADLPMPALQGRSMYVVQDVLTVDGTGYIARHGGSGALNGAQMARLQVGAWTNGDMRVSSWTRNGSTNIVLTANDTRTLGRHVHASSLSDGMTEVSYFVDDSRYEFASLTPGEGFDTTATELFEGDVNGKGVVLLMYDRHHDETTMRRITAWLARRYGAPIPAGY